MRKLNYIVILFAILVVACNVSTTAGNRSGTIDDDYIEEPLSKSAKKYAVVLESSNKIIELVKSEKYSEIHNSFVDESMKSIITEQVLETAFSDTKQAMGDVIDYKKMQWGFVSTVKNKLTYVFSYKIIFHEKGRLDYSFGFKEDGDHTKIISFAVKPRSKARMPHEA